MLEVGDVNFRWPIGRLGAGVEHRPERMAIIEWDSVADDLGALVNEPDQTRKVELDWVHCEQAAEGPGSFGSSEKQPADCGVWRLHPDPTIALMPGGSKSDRICAFGLLPSELEFLELSNLQELGSVFEMHQIRGPRRRTLGDHACLYVGASGNGGEKRRRGQVG